MDRLWAPWRMEYIKKSNEKRCFLCSKIKRKKDKTDFVLLRTKKVVSVLNVYPYNNGHIMIAPIRHISSIEKLNSAEAEEIFLHIKKIVPALKKTLKPGGFNIGFNLGEIAGAGLKNHIHLHLVPRWEGDTNFMPILANTKVIPQSLKENYRKIKDVLDGKS